MLRMSCFTSFRSWSCLENEAVAFTLRQREADNIEEKRQHAQELNCMSADPGSPLFSYSCWASDLTSLELSFFIM